MLVLMYWLCIVYRVWCMVYGVVYGVSAVEQAAHYLLSATGKEEASEGGLELGARACLRSSVGAT